MKTETFQNKDRNELLFGQLMPWISEESEDLVIVNMNLFYDPVDENWKAEVKYH